MNYVIVSEKRWNKGLVDNLQSKFSGNNFVLIDNRDDFNYEYLSKLNPKYIFIPHWSHIIKADIYKKFECIVFHMTDLPYGRGGSPLQNLILSGKKDTMISAIRVEGEVDAGDVYLKKSLSLCGTAEEIFIEANKIIEKMIVEIITIQPLPIPQKGEVTKFKRRKPSDGDIGNLKSIEMVYDYIRMLDATGYPHAFIENDSFRFEFTRASIKSDKSIIADVRIIKK